MHPIPILVLLAGLPLAVVTLPGLPHRIEPAGFGTRCRASGTPAGACHAMASNIAMLLRQEAPPEPPRPPAVPAGRRTW